MKQKSDMNSACKLNKISILFIWNSPTPFNLAVQSVWTMEILPAACTFILLLLRRWVTKLTDTVFNACEKLLIKEQSLFPVNWRRIKVPPFILKRHLQAEGEMTAQTSSSKVLPVAEGVFFFLPLSVNGEALGSLVVARQLHQDCCGKWRSAGSGTWRVQHAGHDCKNVQFTKESNQRDHIRCVVPEVLCCCVRTIICSNMFHHNDKKETEMQIQEVTFSLSWFVIATVTWCNKCFCNHGLFKPSDAVIKTRKKSSLVFSPVETLWETAAQKLIVFCLSFEKFWLQLYIRNDEIT